MSNQLNLSRRERQIMDVVYRLGRASASEIQAELPDPPSYSAVRALVRLLEEKGFVKHERNGLRYVYRPTIKPEDAKRSALRHLVHTFFAGSSAAAASALLGMTDAQLSEEEREHLRLLIEKQNEPGE